MKRAIKVEDIKEKRKKGKKNTFWTLVLLKGYKLKSK